MTTTDKLLPNLPIVYVPNKSSHDFTDAYRFGELVFCSDGIINRRDILTMYADLSRAMHDSEPHDYILLTSLTSLCSIACAVFARKHGRLNLLIFEEGAYISRSLDLP